MKRKMRNQEGTKSLVIAFTVVIFCVILKAVFVA